MQLLSDPDLAAFWAQAEGQRVRITRVITYEGDAKWLLDQLGRSLPEGVRRVGPWGSCSIQVVSGEPEIIEPEIIEPEIISRSPGEE